MLEILLILVSVYLGYRWGRMGLARELTELIEQKKTSTAPQDVLVLEAVDQWVFAYSAQGQYLAHAENWSQLFSLLCDRWPDKRWRVSTELSTLTESQWSAAQTAAAEYESN